MEQRIKVYASKVFVRSNYPWRFVLSRFGSSTGTRMPNGARFLVYKRLSALLVRYVW